MKVLAVLSLVLAVISGGYILALCLSATKDPLAPLQRERFFGLLWGVVVGMAFVVSLWVFVTIGLAS